MLTPGVSRVVKEMDIGDNYRDWYFAEERFLPSNKISPYSASLYPSLRMLTPGVSRVVKEMDIGDNYRDWYFAAEFRIGHKVEERDAADKEPSSKPLQEVAGYGYCV